MAKAKKEENLTGLDAIQKAMLTLNSKFGAGSVYQVGKYESAPIDRISVSLGIDSITNGGFPLGRVVEIRGWEAAGKSLVSLLAVASVQRMGKKALYIDYEHALSLEFARTLGVDTDALILCQPDTMEEGFEIVDTLVETGLLGIAVFDSVSAMTPKAELEADIDQNSIGLISRGMSKFLRRLVPKLNNNQTTAIFVGQYREKIGISYGDNRTIVGGNALKYAASVILDLRKSTKEKDKSGDTISNLVVATALKCKVGVPFKECEYSIKYGVGIDKSRELISHGLDLGIVQRNGAWYSYQGTNIGQGEAGAALVLDDNPELFEIIDKEVREKLFN